MSASVAQFKAQYLYRIPSRHGAERWYFWRGKGHPRIRIHEAQGTPAFVARYNELLNGQPPIDSTAKVQTRTLGWLAQLWFTSTEFRALRPVSQRTYRSVMHLALAEVVAPGEPQTYADFPLERLLPKHVRI